MAFTFETKLMTVGSHVARPPPVSWLCPRGRRPRRASHGPGPRGRDSGSPRSSSVSGTTPSAGCLVRTGELTVCYVPVGAVQGRSGAQVCHRGAWFHCTERLCVPPCPSLLFPPPVLPLLSPGGWTLDTDHPQTPSEGAALGAGPWRARPEQHISRGAASQKCV